MALCHPCRHALGLGHSQYVWEYTSIHDTPWSFLAAVDEGCHICQGFFDQIPQEWKQKFRRRVEMSQSSAEEQPQLEDDGKGMTRYYRPRDHATSGSLHLNLERVRRIANPSEHKTLVERPEPAKQILLPVVAEPRHWTITSLSTNSEETFTKIKAWLTKCAKSHVKCRSRRGREADLRWHPTRLVEIESDPESSDRPISLRCRVVESQSNQMPENLRYATLSHRWPLDPKGIQKLTVDTLPLWKASLPVETLSQTFRDAFLASRRLGISYIWIDSLCIIQEGDNYTDWKKEAPTMQKVYSNAEFNICASKNDLGQGLFSIRSPSGYQPLKVELPHLENDNAHYLIRKEWENELMEMWEARVNDSPLASRGWIFQEQLLSSANIHFGDHEVLFECLEMRASESLGSDKDYQSFSRWDHPFFKERLPIPAAIDGGPVSSVESYGSAYDYHEGLRAPGNSNKHEAWHGLLRQYTTLQLTVSSDRLVALSGVAQYFKSLASEDDFYIAGLWRKRLAAEMLWQLKETASREDWEKRKKTRHYLTFSWISVQGEVENRASPHLDYFGFRDLVTDLEPIHYRRSPEAKDATRGEGQTFAEDIFSFPSAPTVEIRLSGFLRPMGLERQTGPETIDRLDQDLRLFFNPWENHQSLDGLTRLDFDISCPELTALNKSGRLFAMPLVGIDEPSVNLWLLLLELVETSDAKDMGRFRRIGVHEVRYLATVDEWIAENISTEHSLNNLPCWRYDELSKKHTIFVI